jgi:hypothetical protein
MATDLTAARTMVRQAASMLDANHPNMTVQCAMAKRFATDAGFKVRSPEKNKIVAEVVNSIISFADLQ